MSSLILVFNLVKNGGVTALAAPFFLRPVVDAVGVEGLALILG